MIHGTADVFRVGASGATLNDLGTAPGIGDGGVTAAVAFDDVASPAIGRSVFTRCPRSSAWTRLATRDTASSTPPPAPESAARQSSLASRSADASVYRCTGSFARQWSINAAVAADTSGRTLRTGS